MKTQRSQQGFTLVEVLMATAIFAGVMISVTQLFSGAMDIQRRAAGYQKMQDNALFVLESIAREVRVSTIAGAVGCAVTLTMTHPVNGTVTYAYTTVSGTGVITRVSSVKGGAAAPITSADVDVTDFSFCIAGTGIDNAQARVTMPITLAVRSGKSSDTVAVSLQTTIVSRDLEEELSN